MGAPLTRYVPSRHYLTAALVSAALSILSAWSAEEWLPAFFPALLFLLASGVLLFLALQPRIDIHEDFLKIGNRLIRWGDIRRLDRIPWASPLLVRLTTKDSQQLLLYPGDPDAIHGLLRHLRRFSREALIDGVPYRQFWGEGMTVSGDRRVLAPPKYQLLRPDDEAEVERLYQRLKAVGHLDPKKSADEK